MSFSDHSAASLSGDRTIPRVTTATESTATESECELTGGLFRIRGTAHRPASCGLSCPCRCGDNAASGPKAHQLTYRQDRDPERQVTGHRHRPPDPDSTAATGILDQRIDPLDACAARPPPDGPAPDTTTGRYRRTTSRAASRIRADRPRPTGRARPAPACPTADWRYTDRSPSGSRP